VKLDVPIPGEREAQERAWLAVSAAHAATERAPSRRRQLGVRLAFAAAACLAATLALAITPPGEAVADWLARTVGAKPRPPVAPALGLPGPGQLLVDTPRGLYTLDRAGRRHRLGDWHEGSFSPRGRFVAAVRGGTLAALDPRGHVRWSLTRPFALSQPAWAPDGLHVAYRSGEGLRVVGGDGRGDRFLAGPMSAAAPVWLDARTVAWAEAGGNGRVRTVDVITGRAGWTSPPGRPARWLVAGRGGLAVVSSRAVRVLRLRDGTRAWIRRADAGRSYTGAAASGSRLALVSTAAGISRVEQMPLRGLTSATASPALPGAVASPVFSPDGRWLLVGWRVADEWLFLSTPVAARVTSVPAVGKRLAPIAPGRWAFPRVLGWAPAP
jgi:hypothetical protein